ncbi:acyltransferase family protein [Photobacterium phosphoreum]|uniref:acyltransferase family protein n=1 Tax=Photobacterium phosphoreum TaxID=659 RepID=UPI001E488C03|nr:acyltransferase family protein [Photobacterium phosphoreum]MCD9482710.1 acyltransferase family protein [Photobacterium phosphoreum]
MKFRTDINGLRAIAVIAVVLFHFNPSWVPGGFAGVDVFFVISGFLMTGLIFRGLENNNFSIINFYVARANRIIPALSVVCLALLVFGWFYLTPLDYRTLGKHVASSMGFISNIIYWRESGYFDAASHSKWLLHTWSLSVEWQFYIIYPVVLVLLKKCMSLTNIKRLLVVGTVVGFIFSIYATYRWPNPAYFLFPTRAWEMMMGGLAFLYPLQNLKETSKKYFEWAGITLILASYAFISKDNLWPGYLALIPVLGAYLIIIAHRSGSVITDNVVMQKVGLWSYSIYLWHWPVVVFGYYFEMQHWEWIGIPVSVVLGFCSYKFVESIKFPALSRISFKPIVMFKPLWMVISVAFLASSIFIFNGISYRSDNDKYDLDTMVERLKPNHGLSNICEGEFTLDSKCRTSDSPEILVWGDSFSMHLVGGILASNPKAKIIQLTKSSCGPFFDIAPIKNGSFTNDCLKFTGKVKKWIQDNKSIKYVVMSSPFGSYYNEKAKIKLTDGREIIDRDFVVNSFNTTLDEFKRLGITPIIAFPPPATGKNFGKCLDYASFLNRDLSMCDFKKDEISLSQQEIYSWLTSLSGKYKTIRIDDFICKDNICNTSLDNTFIYRDNGHLSYEGSIKLGKKHDFYQQIIN